MRRPLSEHPRHRLIHALSAYPTSGFHAQIPRLLYNQGLRAQPTLELDESEALGRLRGSAITVQRSVLPPSVGTAYSDHQFLLIMRFDGLSRCGVMRSTKHIHIVPHLKEPTNMNANETTGIHRLHAPTTCCLGPHIGSRNILNAASTRNTLNDSDTLRRRGANVDTRGILLFRYW